jgi:AcrR family transcriptional regulator
LTRQVFSTEAILDAAREVIVTRGTRGATVEAIARQAGAPIGSIYYRFSSIDELLARVWLRAVRRNQQCSLEVPVAYGHPLESAQAVALAMYDHCLSEPLDTLLLDALSRTELLAITSSELHDELESINAEIETMMARLARALLGTANRAARDLVVLALVDLPHGFAHRQLSSGRATPARRERLPAAVAAVLEGD